MVAIARQFKLDSTQDEICHETGLANSAQGESLKDSYVSFIPAGVCIPRYWYCPSSGEKLKENVRFTINSQTDGTNCTITCTGTIPRW